MSKGTSLSILIICVHCATLTFKIVSLKVVDEFFMKDKHVPKVCFTFNPTYVC